jgi:GT2 family glycosyltransferase
MEVKIYSSGYEHVSDYVLPYVKSIETHEPAAKLTIVDNGSPNPYPAKFGKYPVKRTDNLAIMTSFNRVIDGAWDWVMLTDTDVICNGAFLKYLVGFDPHYIYGQQVFREGDLEWFDGWLFCVPRLIWNAVGHFDEDFKLTGAFQDLDYCIRAKKAGFGLRKSNLPFTHLEANTTHGSPQFWENREYNRRLIFRKHGISLDNF